MLNRERDNKGRFATTSSIDLFYDGMGVWIGPKDYLYVTKNSKRKQVHILEWEKHNGPKPKNMCIHHKDNDKHNFNINNLELLSHSDHLKVHAGWLKKNGEWVKKPCKTCKQLLPLTNFYKRSNGLSNHCKKCSTIVARKYAPSRKNYLKEYREKNIDKFNEYRKRRKEKLNNNPEESEKNRVYYREYYKKNKQRILQLDKERKAKKVMQDAN